MRVLVVCLGNICRSPIGEGLLKHHAERLGLDVFVDSAGTSGWHAGSPPDERSSAVMEHHGHRIRDQRSRPLTREDLHTFDWILAMDRQNLRDILSLGPHSATVQLFVDGTDVPDPYYGGSNGFEAVFQMINKASEDWITQWLKLRK